MRNLFEREQPTVLMYSPDTIGLGHMRRNTAIAAGVAERVQGVSTLLLVGSSAGPYFDLPPGADCVKLPSILKTGLNTWQPKSLNIPSCTALDLRARIIAETAAAFSPDVFLVDHMPKGIWGELIPALKLLREMPSRPKLVLGLRDILGAPNEIRASWMRDGVYEIIEEYYDEILIYGDRDNYPSCELYGLRQRFAERIRYCGYVCFAPGAPALAGVKRHLARGSRPSIVVTAGGGHDAFPMMNAVLDCVAEMASSLPFDLTLVTGPLMPGADRQIIGERASRLPITVLTATPELHIQMSAADLVITMGGYNTVMEALRIGTPMIVIPRTGPSAEQCIRASLFDELGLVKCVELAKATPAGLASEIFRVLESPGRPAFSLRFSGLRNAAGALADLLLPTRFQLPAADWRARELTAA